MRFNLANVPEDNSFDLLPNGEYLGEIRKITQKWKEGTNNFALNIEFAVAKPEEFAERRVFEYCNVIHSSEAAQRIGQQRVLAITKAIGIYDVIVQHQIDLEQIEESDLNELFCNKPFIAKIGIKKDKTGQYGDQNTILDAKRYDPTATDTVSRAPARPTAAPAAAPAPAPRARKPWER